MFTKLVLLSLCSCVLSADLIIPCGKNSNNRHHLCSNDGYRKVIDSHRKTENGDEYITGVEEVASRTDLHVNLPNNAPKVYYDIIDTLGNKGFIPKDTPKPWPESSPSWGRQPTTSKSPPVSGYPWSKANPNYGNPSLSPKPRPPTADDSTTYDETLPNSNPNYDGRQPSQRPASRTDPQPTNWDWQNSANTNYEGRQPNRGPTPSPNYAEDNQSGYLNQERKQSNQRTTSPSFFFGLFS